MDFNNEFNKSSNDKIKYYYIDYNERYMHYSKYSQDVINEIYGLCYNNQNETDNSVKVGDNKNKRKKLIKHA